MLPIFLFFGPGVHGCHTPYEKNQARELEKHCCVPLPARIPNAAVAGGGHGLARNQGS